MNETANTPASARKKGKYASHTAPKRKPSGNGNKTTVVLSVLLAVCTLALLSALIFLFSADTLTGSWRIDEITVYEFDGKGSGALVLPDQSFAFAYWVSKDTLTIDFVSPSARDFEYTFSIQGDTLTLTGGEGNDTVSYTLTRVSE